MPNTKVPKTEVAQNKAIKSVEDRLEDAEKRLDALEKTSENARLAELEKKVAGLEPVQTLLDKVHLINRHFGGAA